ncbi:MAG: ABC transporter transmembrane domain-containing protein [Sedimenticola sp.]
MPAKETECTEREAGKLELLSKTSSWMKLMFITPKFGADALILIVASIAINLLALALPIALMQVYDRIIPNSSLGTLSWLMIGVSTAIILETVVKILRSFNSNWLSARMEHILNTEAIKYFLSARLDKFEKDKSGVHFERFNSINIIRSYFSGQILLILLDVPFAILFLYMLYYIGGMLLLLPLFLMAIFITIIMVAKRKFEKYNEENVDLEKENFDFILESLGGIHTIKSMNMEDKIHRKFENIQARTCSSSLNANRWKSAPSNSSQFIIQLNMLGIIFFGADLVINGLMTIGALTACTMLASRGIQPVIKLAGSWLRFSEVTIAQKQLEKIIDLKDRNDVDEVSVVNDIEGAVIFDNVCYADPERGIIINDFNENIHAGEFIGVTGDNNEHTTALMLLICGMYNPSSGNIFIDEYRVSKMNHSHFNGKVEYLSKTGRVFNGTILDNISLFDENKHDAALDTASLLELDKFVAELPHGYESLVDQRSNDSLPLGLIQRTCIARALTTCPRVLVIDRTLNSLDDESFELVLEILETIRGRCTVFLVADYGDFPLKVDRVIKCSSDGVSLNTVH